MKNVFKVAVVAIAMVMAAATAGAQTTGTTPTMLEKGDQVAGVKLAFGEGNLGVGAKYQYSFTDRIRVDGSFTYFLPKTEGSGITKSTVSFFEISANGHYLFPVHEGINVYALAGLGYVNVTAKADMGELGDYSAGSSDFGANLGGGVDYFLSEKMILNAEAKYMTCAGGMFVVSAGVGFMF